MEREQFSFANFYAKRIRRLFPALIALLFSCALIEYFIGLPNEVQSFGLSAISSAFYFSNHFFLSQNDYFAESLETNPLLHTWSLSVEEQFYIVFPALLLLVFRRQRRTAGEVILVMAAISLAFSEILIYFDKSTSFFIAPSRFWQFLAGSILAIKPLKKPLPRSFMEFIALSGLGMLMASFFLYSDESTFPGISALIPTLATVMVIFAGQQRNYLSNHLLSNPIAKFFSNISYSLYLWHWPILVFYKLQISPEPSSSERNLIILLSILMGYLSWKLIENPFRRIQIANRQHKTIVAGVLASIAISLICLTFVTSEGGRGRFSTKQLSYIDFLDYNAAPYFRTDTCFLTSKSNSITSFQKDICVNFHFKKPNVLLVGDSHGAQYFSALQQSIPSVEFSQVNASGCRPVMSYIGEKRCTVLMKLALEEYAKDYKFDAIILAGRWETKDIAEISRTVEQLSMTTGKVIVLGPIIEYKQALPRLLARFNPDQRELSEARLLERVKKIDERMQSALSLSDSEYYSILNTICPNGGCRVFTSTGSPIQFDASHLTHEGALEIVEELVEQGMLRGLIDKELSNS